MTPPGMVRLMNMTEEHGRHLQRVRALFQRLLDERGYVVAATAREWRVGDRWPTLAFRGVDVEANVIIKAQTDGADYEAQLATVWEEFGPSHLPEIDEFYYRVVAE